MLKHKHSYKLWFYFAFIIFTTMFLSFLGVVFIIYALNTFGHTTLFNSNPLYPLFTLLLISMLISTIVLLFVGRKILTPIIKLSTALNEVSKGNFNVRIPNNHFIKEITLMTNNFNLMVQELSSIETLRNDFIANVSHEFKTPLSSIEGYAALLQDKSLSEIEHDEYTKMIIESTRQLSTLSSNILKISKLENQEIIIKKTTYRLDEQIRHALLFFENKWNEKNINLDIELNSIIFYGNEDLLMQIWINIISNAIKFTPQNGTICITLNQLSDWVEIKISDTGIGMSIDTQKHIFDKFYQNDKDRSVQGNGLGLTLVKKILELCNGQISVESEPGKGTTFIIKLQNTSPFDS
ncbi:HAMP domain-containing histidine kinase [Clostridium felsineum]|nr:HAMP domain-containing histidine kinase [Clostridium felsineum]